MIHPNAAGRAPARSRLACLLVIALSVLDAAPVTAQERLPLSPDETQAGVQVGETFMLSSDSSWLAFASSKGFGFADLATGRKINAGSGWDTVSSVAWSAWSPTASMLAMRVQREGKRALQLWKAGDDIKQVRELAVFPSKLYPAMPPLWSHDGKTLFFVIHQNLPWVKSDPRNDNPPTSSHNVNLQLTAPYRAAPWRKDMTKEYPEAYAESNRSLIMAVDIASGRMGLLAKGNDIDNLLYLSPDGKRLATVQIKRNPPDAPAGARTYGDVYLLDIPADLSVLPRIDLETFEDRKAGWSDHAGRRAQPVLTNLFTSTQFNGNKGNPQFNWAPDSRSFAFATVGRHASGDVYVYDLASKQLRNLTERVVLPAWSKTIGYADGYVHPYDSPRFGDIYAPLWLPDGSALLARARGEVWLIPLDDKQAPRRMTEQFPLEVRRILPAFNRNIVATDAGRRVILIAKDKELRHDSVWRLDPIRGSVTAVAQLDVWTNYLALDTGAAQLFYSGQTAQSAINIHSRKLDTADAAPRWVTDYQKDLPQREHPRSQVLRWQTPEGLKAYGLLYLPRGASAATKVPMVMPLGPGGEASFLDLRAESGVRFYDRTLDGLLREGFAVFYCDIPMSDLGIYAQPMKQVVDGVMAATDAAIASGMIDERRMGIAGLEYGGFAVSAVLTHTDRFKVAASIGGWSNWAAGFTRNLGMADHEAGIGRFERPLWEEPQRYLENSPMNRIQNIHTPLLIAHGEQNEIVPMHNAEEMFGSLQRLGNTTILARYTRQGGGSSIETERRVRRWFREHLLGADPITQIADQGSFFLGED